MLSTETSVNWDNVNSNAQKSLCHLGNLTKGAIVGMIPVIAYVSCVAISSGEGAAVGSVVPGWGTLIGGVAGAASSTVFCLGAAGGGAVAALALMTKYLPKDKCDEYELDDFDLIQREIKEMTIKPYAKFMNKTYSGNSIKIDVSSGRALNEEKLKKLEINFDIDKEELLNISNTSTDINSASIYFNINYDCFNITGGSICYSETNTTPSVGGASSSTAGFNYGYSLYKFIQINNLKPDTEYYIRAYVITEENEIIYSKVKKIKTLPDIKLNLSVNNITQTSANCNVTVSGVTEITNKGVCWNTSGNPTIASSKIDRGTGVSNFSASLTGLKPETTYYARAYINLKDGNVIYSNLVSFKTLEEEEEEEPEEPEMELKDTYFANTKWNVTENGTMTVVIKMPEQPAQTVTNPLNQTYVMEFTKDALIADMPTSVYGVSLGQKVTVINKGKIIITITASLSGITTSYDYTFTMSSANSTSLSGETKGGYSDQYTTMNFSATLTGVRIK